MRVAVETRNVEVMYIGEDEVSIVKRFKNGDYIMKSKTLHKYYFVKNNNYVLFSIWSEIELNLSLYS